MFSTHAGQSSRYFFVLFSKMNTDHVYIASQGSLMTKCSAVILSEKTIIIEYITDKEGTKYKAKRVFFYYNGSCSLAFSLPCSSF